MLNLFTMLVFLFVLVLVYVLRAFSQRRLRREAVEDRLEQLKRQVEQDHPVRRQDADDSIVLAQDAYAGPFAKLRRAYRKLSRNIEMLGWSKNLRLRVLAVLGCGLVGSALVARMTPYPVTTVLIGTVALSAAIGMVAYQSAMNKYMEALGQALPEAIDSIARICRSGVPAQSSFAIAAENLRGPLAGELLALDHWLRLGVPLRQALQESAQRVPLREYRFFAVILIISQESGGRLADTLGGLATTLRSRAELAMKVQAKTSEARASIKIVATLVPGVLAYMYFNAPNDFQFLLSDPAGVKVLAYSAASVLSGLGITYAMVRRVR
ncbi:hypothetical protein GKC30_12885 [Pseudodesulfovibrio sp. F-1]|uniref:Type II secretion system protein GspF domain-containing protein n=1 Tax=Pseudodesulfovibrio alkaliphilus TaxID=2661613 RepID=A0A7K1KRI3_9BACT|nr:type II secretion system F family protein [Pseudodesulfovibrio alkaliphilus]MUM78532.1 hypothetical protein [Pseudodesulfovibrio alkaliphilus]